MNTGQTGATKQLEEERMRIQAEMERFRKEHETSLRQFSFEKETYKKAWDEYSKDFPAADGSSYSQKARRLRHELEMARRQVEEDMNLYQKKYRELIRLTETESGTEV